MADRGRGRGRGGAPRGGGPGQGGGAAQSEKPKRENILDLSKYVETRIRVKFQGGREVTGLLKGYDPLMNIVLDDVEENLTDPQPHARKLGLVVLRGPTITLLSPVDGSEEIENPFLAATT